MTSFRSRHYPKHRNGLMIVQEYAMQYYAILMLFVMAAVMLKVYVGQNPLWWGIFGTAAAIGLGNIMAYVNLNRNYAEIFFVNEHFSLISVHEILNEKKNDAFPLHYANAQRIEDEITLHFNDQIVTLKAEDWEEFDLIWSWLNSV